MAAGYGVWRSTPPPAGCARTARSATSRAVIPAWISAAPAGRTARPVRRGRARCCSSHRGTDAMPSPTIRPLEERDADRAGDVNFVAFHDVALRHGQTPIVSLPADARSYVRHLLAFDPLGGLVAEVEGEIVGMAWVHVRGPVATIGPIAVAPRWQGRGIGRRLLERCVEHAGPRVPQVRLVHESYNASSLGLYLRAGFRVVAPLVELELAAPARLAAVAPTGVQLRAATEADRTRLAERDGRAFGAPRPQSVELYLRRGRALIAERGTTMAGYAFGIGFGTLGYLGSASAEDGEVLLE